MDLWFEWVESAGKRQLLRYPSVTQLVLNFVLRVVIVFLFAGISALGAYTQFQTQSELLAQLASAVCIIAGGVVVFHLLLCTIAALLHKLVWRV